MSTNDAGLRHDWSLDEVVALFSQSLNDLLFNAQIAHRHYFDPNAVQLSTLLNIKSGGCPEDCAYCPQSIRYHTGVSVTPLMTVSEVVDAARRAIAYGATRFCMGAAWRRPKGADMDQVLEMVSAVKALGLESCVTLGMLTREQAVQLKEAGLDFYNHNLDSSQGFYETIITTRTYKDRLQTLEFVREAGIHVCCGGIIGMGEATQDRAELLLTLANMPRHPESVPINLLVQVEGTPLAGIDALDPFELIRTVAVARLLMPASFVRLSAGRLALSDEAQALCFYAGANSIFYGEKLLTTDNPDILADQTLFRRLGLRNLA